MSETVIISKTSPRQRPQPREPPSTRDGSESGRLEKLAGKSKSTASLVMVKELVHRDNSRLVKDLMALLAIREATKDATVPIGGPQSNEGDGVRVELKKDETLLKNRPGDTTMALVPTVQDGEEAAQGGTKATMTAAAVASLLHHTATKEFSSLAGEIIAIADDTPTANSNEANPLDGEGTAGTITGYDDELMLHADAAAPELSTNENSTDEATDKREDGFPARQQKKDRQPSHQDTKGEIVSVAGSRYEERRAKTDASEMGDNLPQRPSVECLPSGPVPVDVVCGPERTATPIPTYGASYMCHGLVSPVETVRPATLTLEQKLDKLLDSVVKIKADMHRRIDRLGKRVEQIHLDVQLNIDSTDRALLRNDLLLIGIPHREPREDLQQCFRDVCRALEYTEQDIPQVDIRRQRVPGGSRRVVNAGSVSSRGQKLGDPADPIAPAPIVVEFMFKTLRDQFYRAYQAKRVLRLSDIGFSSDRRFFVNEVLTKYNQKLMAEAVRRKRLGQLHSVYTVDGIVYVQRAAGEKGTKVTSFSSLN
uniref:Uncharacterized protein n=1 Tax=Anopheles minimus TaxID=112268 RepID=A0A182WK00_9DIPT